MTNLLVSMQVKLPENIKTISSHKLLKNRLKNHYLQFI